MSPMGTSGGRSAAHRTGKGAVRRATPEERSQTMHPEDEMRPLPWLGPPAQRAMAGASWLILAAVLVILVLLLAA